MNESVDVNESADMNESHAAPKRKASSMNPWVEALLRLGRNKTAVVSFAVFALICLACVMAPYLARWDYRHINVPNRRALPSRAHIMGTDALGRDIFSRVLYGGRTTLRVALAATSLAMVIGSALGLAAGYIGRRADYIVSPILDVLASIPVILLAPTIEAVFGRGEGYFMYAIVVAAIPQFARLVRASVMDVVGCEYIEAARALGVSHAGIVSRHVLHNIAPPLIVRFTSGVAEALLTCTIMGYLDIGIRPPTPEWGQLVFNARVYLLTAPIMVAIPSSVIAITVISLSLFGDGLRDALDVKSQAGIRRLWRKGEG